VSKAKKPDFFIVGGRKCGTTSLYSHLKDHPEIFMPRWKEPHFFGSDLHARNFSHQDYLSLFSKAPAHKKAGEASTGYLFSKKAAAEIKEFNSTARIIIMLRNPVEAIHSLHSEYVFEAVEGIEDFEAALNAETRRQREPYVPPPAVPMEFLYYRQWVAYADQVRRYYDLFGRENVHIIILDEFHSKIGLILRDTFEFLGVDQSFQPKLGVRNPNKLVHSRKLQRFLLDTRRPFALWARQIPGNILIRSLVRLNTRNGPRPAMNPELRRRLTQEFAPEIERLGGLLGRDLSHWCKTD